MNKSGRMTIKHAERNMKKSDKETIDRIHKPYTEYKDSEDRIERLTYWIWQLSPHNLWKGYEALKELERESRREGRRSIIEEIKKGGTLSDLQ